VSAAPIAGCSATTRTSSVHVPLVNASPGSGAPASAIPTSDHLGSTALAVSCPANRWRKRKHIAAASPQNGPAPIARPELAVSSGSNVKRNPAPESPGPSALEVMGVSSTRSRGSGDAGGTVFPSASVPAIPENAIPPTRQGLTYAASVPGTHAGWAATRGADTSARTEATPPMNDLRMSFRLSGDAGKGGCIPDRPSSDVVHERRALRGETRIAPREAESPARSAWAARPPQIRPAAPRSPRRTGPPRRALPT
jgi:hypothetical protein